MKKMNTVVFYFDFLSGSKMKQSGFDIMNRQMKNGKISWNHHRYTLKVHQTLRPGMARCWDVDFPGAVEFHWWTRSCWLGCPTWKCWHPTYQCPQARKPMKKDRYPWYPWYPLISIDIHDIQIKRLANVWISRKMPSFHMLSFSCQGCMPQGR